MIHVKNITHSFGDKLILEDVSFSLERGEIIGLVAPNGTGKTTLLNIVMNFISPDSGEITFEDKGEYLDYSSSNKEVEMHKRITFLPELEHLYVDLTGRDHLNYYASLWPGKVNVNNIIERLNIESYVNNKVGTYSLGMKQRLAFAMMLCANSPIMLMDELMNGLDPENVDLLTEILIELKENGKTILIASHLLNNLDIYADRLILIKNQNIIVKNYKFHEELSNNYLKVSLTESKLKEIQKHYDFPKNSQMMNKNLFVIPLTEINQSTIIDMINIFLKHNVFEVSISSLGASEWYDFYYRNPDY